MANGAEEPKSEVLFSTNIASLYKLPFRQWYTSRPDKVDIASLGTDSIWKGSIRLLSEHPQFPTTTTSETPCYAQRRIKLEFINGINHDLESFWGEVWYIPPPPVPQRPSSVKSESSLILKRRSEANGVKLSPAKLVSRDGSSTIIPVEGTIDHFRVLVQLPDSGFHPRNKDEVVASGPEQVALVLKLNAFQARLFVERLREFDADYKSGEQAYLLDQLGSIHRAKMDARLDMSGLKSSVHKLALGKHDEKMQDNRSSRDDNKKGDEDEEEEDEFGDYVSQDK
ncbi:uncharacterized protein LODBEIA_P09740 [Lodderomyces beijingensis]|uniref:Uncharacterized protein n=1 Tax=Lodderomyces beijingensis TaxID=1775926 RepID=A0ABP0ZKE3_9ASCO